MQSRKNWIWILSAVLGCGVVGLAVAAGAGVYFVTRHIHVQTSTRAAATAELDGARARFGDAQPLFDAAPAGQHLEAHQKSHARHASSSRPDDLHILAWDPDTERLVRVSLPFWVLRYGHQRVRFRSPLHEFDLSDLKLDLPTLEREGPALLVDHRDPSGHRVVVWTE